MIAKTTEICFLWLLSFDFGKYSRKILFLLNVSFSFLILFLSSIVYDLSSRPVTYFLVLPLLTVERHVGSTWQLYSEVALQMKGLASLVFIDCS